MVYFFTASQLKPEKVDFHKDQNREAHKTDDYYAANLIIRRGQEFDVTVTFNREYNPGTDEIVLQFVTGLLKFSLSCYCYWRSGSRLRSQEYRGLPSQAFIPSRFYLTQFMDDLLRHVVTLTVIYKSR